MKDMKIAGVGLGGILAIIGILLISPIIDGWNFTGLIILLVGLIGFGGFAKGKWY